MVVRPLSRKPLHLVSALLILAIALALAAPAHAQAGVRISGQVTGIYPGATKPLKAKVRNRYGFAVRVRSITTVVGDASPGCPRGNLLAPKYRHKLTVRPRRSKRVNIQVSMPASAPNACQGATFPLRFKAKLQRLAHRGKARRKSLRPGSGTGSSAAATMPSGKTPTGNVSAATVAVSWQSASGGVPVSDYLIKRYNNSSQLQSIHASCTGTISALSCTEKAVPAGTWKYTDTPVVGNWRGAESPKSSPITVSPQPAFSLDLTSVTSLPATITGQIAHFANGESVTFRLDHPTAGPTLAGSITPDPVPANGIANVSVTLPAGVMPGGHTIYAVGDAGDTAAAVIIYSQPTTFSSSAWDLRDASSGVQVNKSDPVAFADDGLKKSSGNFLNTFQSNRYLDYTYNSPLAPGLATSNVSFDFNFAPTNKADGACFYFEVYSNDTLIGTHGSAASPVACQNSTTALKATSTPLPEVNSTDVANGLEIKVFGQESGKRPIAQDLAAISGTAGPSQPFTLYEVTGVDSAKGTPTTTKWPLATGDGIFYKTLSNWLTTIPATPTRSLTVHFPAYVPEGATINTVNFKHSFRSDANGSNACYYFDVYSGDTLLDSHGDGSNPVDCNASNTSWVTDDISLPEVTTADEANDLTIKLYFKSSLGKKSQHDLAQLRVNYTP